MTTESKLKENKKTAVFSYSANNQLRCIQLFGESWFVAKDICDTLGLTRSTDAIKKLDKDEKLMRKVSSSGQARVMWLVNESGLYALIMRSNKPEAKRFRKWVTQEVLPQIRKTGQYKPKGLPTKSQRNHNRLTPARMVDIMVDIAKIDNKEIRLSLIEKLGLSTESNLQSIAQ